MILLIASFLVILWLRKTENGIQALVEGVLLVTSVNLLASGYFDWWFRIGQQEPFTH